MLVARRNKWGMVGKVSGRTYRECLPILHPHLTFRYVPSSRRMHLDPLVSTEEDGMWLASRLSKEALLDPLSEECYLNDDVGLHSIESICGSRLNMHGT